MAHYRVTRPEGYGPNTPGYTDLGARQGHYIDASSPEEARSKIRLRLSKDEWSGYRPGEPLDVQPWGKGGCNQAGETDFSELGRTRACDALPRRCRGLRPPRATAQRFARIAEIA